VFRSALLALLIVASASAQTAPFAVRVQLADSALDVLDGGNIPFVTSGIGRSVTANITFTNRGAQLVTVNFTQLTGAADFTLSGVPDGSFTVAAGQLFTAQVVYAAANSNRNVAQFRVNYTVGNTTANLTLNLTGTAPEFVYSVTPQGGNATPLAPGATVQFPVTPVDGQSSAVVVVANRGTAPGIFNSATVSGAEFQTAGVPLPNTTVEPNRDVRFSINFTPRQLEPVQGSLTIETADRRASFTLSGSGAGARFAYEALFAAGAAPVRPGQTIALPDTNVNDKSSLAIRFRNTGNQEGRITTLSVAGAGYSLSETPLLPLTVPVGQAVTFTVNFQPTTPGRAIGRLRIGADDFDLSATALGATLTYTFTVADVANPVSPNGAVIFTPAAVGTSSSLRFTITNTGTAATTISSIGLAAPSTIFVLGPLPPQPARLEPNASLGFDITFSPSTLGVTTATLRIDSQSFILSGAGNAPPPLPPLQFDGASGAQEPLQQPAIGLTLARAYPLALTGTLTLVFNSDVFAADPAVQFATGGRTVTFTIPANTTRAVFPNNATSIRVQTGSVAGAITITPTIGTSDGGINLTPAAPPSVSLTVAAGAPRILSAVVSARTANSITLLINGYATSRSVTSMELNFTPTTGENVATTRLTVPLESAFLGYYQSATSAPFGSLFSLSVPLTFAGDLKGVTQLSDTIQAMTVTLSNRLGASPAAPVTLR
jgi:hypothetical protein